MDVFDAKVVKTRKPHQCHGCLRRFPAGSSLQRVKLADGGRVYTVYWCKACKTAFHEWGMDDDDVGAGEMRTGDPEAWEEVRQRVEAMREDGGGK